MKIVYCGYDFFHSCMAGLVAANHEIVELFTWPTDNEYDFNDNVLSIAQSHKMRITLSPMLESDLLRFKEAGVDAIICAAYPFKIPKWQGFVKYALNIHPSPLPLGRGPWPLPWIILKGLERTGVTIHEVSANFDAGDILAQSTWPISDRETLESLSLRSQITAKNLLLSLIGDIDTTWKNKIPQGNGTYWPMPKKEDRTIDFAMPVRSIDRIVRAFSKFEPFLFLDNQRYFVRKVDFWEEAHYIPPGTLVHKANREVVYAASDGFLCLSNYTRAPES